MKPKEETSTQEMTDLSTNPPVSRSKKSGRNGDPSRKSNQKQKNTRSKQQPTSVLTESEMIEDDDLHQDWKKFRGPEGQPIYINQKTSQSSKERPDEDGNVRRKSLFHRSSVFQRVPPTIKEGP